jgi:hypothetical protein
MSTLAQIRFQCPGCARPAEGEIGLVVQVNKRRDLERAILERRFNVIRCACGHATEIVRTVAVTDFERKLWVVAWPGWAEVHWRDLAEATRAQFQRTLAKALPGDAPLWRVRAVFGYEPLREKLVLAAAGLDDRAVEVAKGKLLAGRLDRIAAHVLVDRVTEGEIRFRVVTASGQHQLVDAPRAVLDPRELVPGNGTADLGETWRADVLGFDPFVSFRRWIVAPRPADPLAFDLNGVSADQGWQRTTWDDTAT